MRPLRLTMTAFGPFGGTEEVDFRPALAAGLFGIYGPTGAGKSSIFNAMTFALFGESAKDGQESRALRSDHAAADVLTCVEFIFDLGSNRYLLRRWPEQNRPKARGSGFTTASHKAELFDVTGMEPEQITAAQSGRVIAENKVTLVDTEVRTLLGYGPAQFRQIVLLPQGAFERFLTAGTDDRLTILRQLFDVSKYRRIEAWFKDAASASIAELRSRKERIAGQLEGEGFENDTALTEAIEAATEALSLAKLNEHAFVEKAKLAQKALDQATNLVKAFEAAENARKTLNDLERASDNWAKRRERVALLRRAAPLVETANHLQGLTQEAQRAKDDAQQLAKAALSARAESEKQEKVRTEQEAKSPEIDRLKQTLSDLERYGSILAKSREQEQKRKDAKAALTQARNALATAKSRAERCSTALRDGAARRDHLLRAQSQRATLGAQSEQLLTALNDAKAHQRLENATQAAARAQTEAEAQLAHELTVHRQAQSTYEQAEKALSSFQALVLARKLEDGTPCPVCGSSDHPAPADGTPESAGRDERFRSTKQAAQQAEKNWQDARMTAELCKQKAQDLAEQLSTASKPKAAAHELEAELHDIRSQIDLLPSEDPDHISIEQLEAQSLAATAHEQSLEKDLSAAQTALAVAEQALKSALEDVPEPLRGAGTLSREVERTQRALSQHTQALDAARTKATRVRDTALTAQNQAEAAALAAKRADEARAVILARMEDGLAQAGLTLSEFSTLSPMVANVDKDAKDVETYDTDCAVARASLAEREAATQGQTKPDLRPLNNAVAICNAEVQDAAKASGRAEARANQLSALQTRLAHDRAEVAAYEAETGPLRELSARFNGDNTHRLTLETYALQAMFDQVLDAANLRLWPMSDHRFSLQREGAQVKGRAKRGLGIEVHDTHTGTSRPTATLSGGETFMAALALALGLSDVVEQSTGSIRLDTIFIDEGFGSLDADDGAGTLETVLQILTQTSGADRAVGLISHVGLVKDAIPDGFQIDKTPRGSHVRIRNSS